MDSGSRAFSKPRCQICPCIHPGLTTPVIPSHLFISQLYIGQQISAISFYSPHWTNRSAPMQRKHFNLPGHSIADLKVTGLKQKNFKRTLQPEIAELKFFHKFRIMPPPHLAVIWRQDSLSYYRCYFCSQAFPLCSDQAHYHAYLCILSSLFTALLPTSD